MKKFVCTGAVALFVVGGLTLKAETRVQPGQLAGSAPAVAAEWFSLESGAYSAHAPGKADIAMVDDERHDRFMNRLWIASMMAAVAGTSFDAATSWGKYEGNGFLASADGRFGAKGVSLKAGLAAAVFMPQIALRRHKELRVPFIVGNFAQAALFGGVAVHNLGVRTPSN